jgi:phospholipase C
VERLAIIGALLGAALFGAQTAAPARASSPIQHIVVLYQENHSFDNVLGYWCAQTGHCVGLPPSVTLKGGVVVVPTVTPNRVPQTAHTTPGQLIAMDGGAMDGWAGISGCAAPTYACISGYTPAQVPNIIALASSFAISDETFSEKDSPSWGGHLYAVAATTDGFVGNVPSCPVGDACAVEGWGCDSGKITQWINPAGKVEKVPSCVPDPALSMANGGAFKPTPASFVPTMMDRLDASSLSWRIYTTTSKPAKGVDSYMWATCPSFAECLDTSQRTDMVPTDQVLADAAAGTLPAFSLVLPSADTDPISGGASQHNGKSMAVGDQWIGTLTSALENGPEWDSTALFITYDDCGCFYDQVPPGLNPDGTQQGTRVPLVIVSPYAKPGYVDSTLASFASILAFTEQNFGLPPLNINDRDAYAFTNAFDYAQTPLAPVPMVHIVVSQAARLLGGDDSNDPT